MDQPDGIHAERFRRGTIYIKAALFGLLTAGIFIAPLTYIALRQPPPQTIKTDVPNLELSIKALGAPVATGTLSEISESVSADCGGWPVAEGFILVCQPTQP